MVQCKSNLFETVTDFYKEEDHRSLKTKNDRIIPIVF